MPIDTSVITGTQAHRHSIDSSDGGFLQSAVTGMTNLTEGGIIQGAAGNIQTNLPIGAAGERLAVNAGATALEYVAAGGGASCSDILNVGNAGQNLTLCQWLELGA